jgi:hypothetical protein
MAMQRTMMRVASVPNAFARGSYIHAINSTFYIRSAVEDRISDDAVVPPMLNDLMSDYMESAQRICVCVCARANVRACNVCELVRASDSQAW